MKTISKFAGQYRFLSNFYPARVVFARETYPTVEHAYQAAKTTEDSLRALIRAAPTPRQAKEFGRAITPLRPNWDEIRIEVMTLLVSRKFSVEPLRGMLLETSPSKLIEGNTWGDRFWGVCDGEGENHLGRILMKVRDDLDA